LSAAVEIGHTLRQGAPIQLALGVVAGAAEDLEVVRPGDGGLDAQNAAGLVVHLDGIAAHPVLDADALGPVLEAGDDLPGEVAVDLAAEEAHDVGALEVLDRVAHERRIDPGQRARILEEDVRGPLGLIPGPVVLHRLGLEDLGVLRALRPRPSTC
jgi:hypothetical protein